MSVPGVRLSFDGVPAAYRRGIEETARLAGVLAEDGTPVVLIPLGRADDRCSVIEELARDGVVLALLQPFEPETITHALSHGAFVADEDAEPEDVVATVVDAVRGIVRMPRARLAEVLGDNGAAHGSVELTDEERAWLTQLAEGATVVRLADEFGYSERALFRRLHALYVKLGAANRSEAIVSAQRAGLLERRST